MQPQKGIHFNGLNGIRAICALSVVISHASSSLQAVGIKAGPVLELAGYGVTAFFALSGFLITYLLIAEKEAYTDISVTKFYLRRILRIWPLYFSYMGIAILADVLIFHVTDFSSIWFYLFFFPNIPFSYEIVGLKNIIPILLLGHFWSLGVEEQFYAFYPWLMKWFKNIFRMLITMFILVLIIKLLAKYMSHRTGNPFWYSWVDNTRFDVMAIGGLGAWFYRYRAKLVKQLVDSVIIKTAVTVILALVITNNLRLPNTISHMLLAIVTVITIYYAHIIERPYINLRNRYINYLGKISFGIYVYHPLAIAFAGLLMKNWLLPMGITIPLFIVIIIGFTIVMAALSYRYFESYFLKLKFKFAVVKSKD